MLFKKMPFLLLCSLATATPCFAGEVQPITPADWTEVNTSFTFHTQPVHPGLLRLFAGNAADLRTPWVTSVDVAAAFNTNEYPSSAVTGKPAELVLWQPDAKVEAGYVYHWVGRLKNGSHVLIARVLGNGRQYEPGELMVVKFEKGHGYDAATGVSYERLLLTVATTYPLGDRADADVTIDGDRINLTTTLHSGEVKRTVLKSEAEPTQPPLVQPSLRR